jgi:hypothetical protein
MMLRLSVSRRQTLEVAPVWCSSLPFKELTVPAPKWSTPCHIIRRSGAIPLDERVIEVPQGGGKAARRQSRHSANASNVGRHFGWATPTDHELGLNATSFHANNGLDVTYIAIVG